MKKGDIDKFIQETFDKKTKKDKLSAQKGKGKSKKSQKNVKLKLEKPLSKE